MNKANRFFLALASFYGTIGLTRLDWRPIAIGCAQAVLCGVVELWARAGKPSSCPSP